MIRRLLISTLAIALVLTLVGASTFNDAASTKLKPARPSVLLLEGSSNVTGWRCTGTTIEGAMEVAAPIDRINEVIDRIEDGNIAVWSSRPQEGRFPPPRFRMRIPIAELNCGNAMMERDMNRALRADAHPAIDFSFKEVLGPIHHDIDKHTYEARIAGFLELAGTQREIEITVTAQRISSTRFRLRAELPLRMTDFGITPPTALFGMIKARDELLVRFDLVLAAEVRS